MKQFQRSEQLLGKTAMEQLHNSCVAVFGIGGVGGHVVEGLARSGVGHFVLVDHDIVEETNINRQIIATYDTLGRKKVEVMKERILQINPKAKVEAYDLFYLPETKEQFDFSNYDYIVDAIDTVSGKIAIIEEANRCQRPVISAMGAGNKLDPTKFCVADIYETKVCPLAKVMRKELKKRNIAGCKVVYSTEQTAVAKKEGENIKEGTRKSPGSVAYVPSVMGLLMAREVCVELTK